MEVKSVKIKNVNIQYFLKNSQRAKNIRLTIQNDGKLVITKPNYIPFFVLNNFIKKKSSWIINKMNKSGDVVKIKNGAYEENKGRALRFIEKRLKQLNENYNFNYNKISVRNQKTCWGSCSPKKNLSFNYKIIFLSEKMADYIMVHELCHLKEMNHSSRFWELVAKSFPDYKEIRKKLGLIRFDL
jgi:predicted metal-dependent hydrolase